MLNEVVKLILPVPEPTPAPLVIRHKGQIRECSGPPTIVVSTDKIIGTDPAATGYFYS